MALAPVCDLREAIRLGLGGGATQALLDGADPDPADPMVLFDERPAAGVAIVHGVDDDDVPRLAEPRLRRSGTPGSSSTRCPAATWV